MDHFRIENLSISFGGLKAVNNVSFNVEPNSIFSIIGPNGSGKTTIFNLISGIYHPSNGRIILEGEDMVGKTPDRIARKGIARTFQLTRPFGRMTCLENVIVGHHTKMRTNLLTSWFHLPVERREEAMARTQALGILKRLGLLELASLAAGKLSYGDQRRVEIARALAQNPRLLLLDEPAAGMNDAETERLAKFLEDLKRSGLTLVIIEHHMDLIMKVCDELVVLNFGRKIAEGSPERVSEDEGVVEAYLGRD